MHGLHMTDRTPSTEAVIIHDELLNELIEIFHARGFNHRMPEDAVVRKRDQRTYHALRELRRTRGLQRLRIAPEPCEKAEDYIARLPADWFKDSSLERWFPLTAEELKRLRMEVETLRRSSGEPRDEHADWMWRWIDRITCGQCSVQEGLSVLTYSPGAPSWVQKMKSSDPLPPVRHTPTKDGKHE